MFTNNHTYLAGATAHQNDLLRQARHTSLVRQARRDNRTALAQVGLVLEQLGRKLQGSES